MRNIARYQLMLIARSPLFIVAVLGLLVIVTVGAVDRTDGFPSAPVEVASAAVMQVSHIALMVFTLLAAWAGVGSKSGRASEMTYTYLHSNTQMAIGQVLGLTLAFAVVQVAIVAWGTGVVWVGYGRIPVDYRAAASLCIMQLLPAAAMAAGLGYAIGYLAGSPVVAYPIAAGLWFAVVLGGVEASTLPQTRWLAVLDMGSAHDFDQGLTALAMATAGFLGAAAAAGLVKRGREAAPARRRMSAAVLAVAVMAFGLTLTASWVLWSPRLAISRNSAKMVAEEAESFLGLPREVMGLRPATDVRSYDMEVHLSPSESRLANTVVMEVANRGAVPLSTLTFTLRGEFVVARCQVRQETWMDASYDRRASLLEIKLDTPLAPGRSCDVRLTYHGMVCDWTLGKFVAFNDELNGVVRQDRAWLPSGLAWYPVPGARRTRYAVATKHAVAKPGAVATAGLQVEGPVSKAVWVENSHPAARMRVVVHTGMAPGTQVDAGIPGELISAEGESPVYKFESDWARDLYLAAGAACPDEVELPDDARAYLERRWAFYESLAPSGRDMVVTGLARRRTLLGNPQLAPQGMIAVDGRVVQRTAKRAQAGRANAGDALSYDRNLVESAVLSAWWQGGGTRWHFMAGAASGEVNVIGGVLRYALVLFLEHNGEPDIAEGVLEEARRGHESGLVHLRSMEAEATLLLEQARQDRGLEAARRVFSLLRAGQAGRDGVVTMDDLRAAVMLAVEEVGHS
ncbi:MAG: hypothetical protein PHH46_05010 [Firmicutes bacterium]|nr:hypothetical protein [Bacillota bacterium]